VFFPAVLARVTKHMTAAKNLTALKELNYLRA